MCLAQRYEEGKGILALQAPLGREIQDTRRKQEQITADSGPTERSPTGQLVVGDKKDEQYLVESQKNR
jgi:hypothetical protein